MSRWQEFLRSQGARFDGFELLEGPDPGARLVVSPPATLESGQSVKERT